MKPNKIATLIRNQREALGLTQLDLSTKLGYETPQFVSLFERGISKVPFETLGKLSVILGIPEAKFTNILVTEFKLNYYKKFDAGKDAVKAGG